MPGWELRWNLPNNSRRMRTEAGFLESAMSHFEIAGDKRGGLKGSMQHWLAVYPPEFQIPMFFVAVD